MDATSQEDLARDIDEHQSRPASGLFLRKPDSFPRYLTRTATSHVLADDEDAAGISPYLLSRRKRLLDVSVSLTILVVLSPLLAMVGMIIRVTSPGPVLFRQMRTGIGGQPFFVYKFRSMYVHKRDPETVVQAARTDTRITPFGRFIRRTSIDELPQILNVLRGNMSLIGPRPHAVQHDAYYGQQISIYDQRFAARPGLSGLAQVNGARGATPQLADMERRVAYDLTYIRSASLIGDIQIIGATVREMIFSSSAY